jgi:TonB family protein
MARDNRSDDQESLFSADGKSEETGTTDKHPDEYAPRDLSSEDERLRNGDISFRPVSLPGSDPEPAVRRGGPGGTALMIVVTIIVVLLLTWVIYTFYSTDPSGSQQAGVTATDPPEEFEQPGGRMEAAIPAAGDEVSREEPAAIFQAHAELQENYRRAEKRIADLESELVAERGGDRTSTPAAGTATDAERLERLEKENNQLKADLERQRRDSEAAVSKAEHLVQRAESRVSEEQGQAAAAREEADRSRQQAEALATENSVLAGEVDTLSGQVNELRADRDRRQQEYDRLAASTTTRLEGESEAVRQLMTRHAAELERERKATVEKEAEVRRLTELIARLSVAGPAPATAEASRTSGSPAAGSTSAGSSSADSGEVTPPRILTKTDPEYPMNARRLRVEGTVLLNVLVGTDGRVSDVKVLEADGGKLLSPAAEDAVRKWTFSPATRVGRPVECWHKVEIRFAL